MKYSMQFPLVLGAIVIGLAVIDARADSLWLKATNNEQGMFADKRARNIGDIVTIVIDESITTTQAQEIKTYDKTESAFGPVLNNIVNQFISQIPTVISAMTGVKSTGENATATGVPIINFGTENKFNGGGTVTGRFAVSSRAAVTVVDVLPNGNLVIEGRKIIGANRETQYAYLRGILRQADVTRDNTALSSNIADAQVEYIPEGELTEAQKKGWLLNAWDKVRPF